MARVHTPLYCLDAHGSLGKTVTFQNWKGLQVAREYSRPSNPNTAAQTTHRARFRDVINSWKLLTNYANRRLPWTTYARRFAYPSAYHAYVKTFLPQMQATWPINVVFLVEPQFWLGISRVNVWAYPIDYPSPPFHEPAEQSIWAGLSPVDLVRLNSYPEFAILRHENLPDDYWGKQIYVMVTSGDYARSGIWTIQAAG